MEYEDNRSLVQFLSKAASGRKLHTVFVMVAVTGGIVVSP